jgi:predicted DCC family thiol-disulfide oxidoreductase YuxK
MPPTFLYDGDCAFCSISADFLERRVRTDAKILPWQWSELDTLGVTQAEAEAAVMWIEPDFKRAGPDAIAVLLRRAQWYWKPLGWVLSLTPVSWLAWPVYRLIARNRHKLPGGTAACSLPQAERDRRRAVLDGE